MLLVFSEQHFGAIIIGLLGYLIFSDKLEYCSFICLVPSNYLLEPLETVVVGFVMINIPCIIITRTCISLIAVEALTLYFHEQLSIFLINFSHFLSLP